MERSKKKHAVHAELAHFYHVNPFDLNSGQLLGLRANIPKLRARERIQTGDYDTTDHEAAYAIYMTAYDDEQLAEAARIAAMEALVKRECDAARQSQ